MSTEQQNESLSQQQQSRRNFRSLLFHILYATDAFDYEVDPSNIAENFNREYELDIDTNGELVQTVRQISELRNDLDNAIVPFLENWRFERIGKCTLLILRYAIWEVQNCKTPHNIIINEAIELAKCFAEKDSYKFVNGILDKIFKQYKANNDKENISEESQDSLDS